VTSEIGLVVKRGSDIAESLAIQVARRAEATGVKVYVEESSEASLLP